MNRRELLTAALFVRSKSIWPSWLNGNFLTRAENGQYYLFDKRPQLNHTNTFWYDSSGNPFLLGLNYGKHIEFGSVNFGFELTRMSMIDRSGRIYFE